MPEKPIVAHVNAVFFEGSETFIYQYLTHHRSWHPVCLARALKNLDAFPFPREDLFFVNRRRYSPSWLFYTALRRSTGRDVLLTRGLRGRDVELIHAHYGLNGYLALGAKRELGVPLVTSFYGFDLSIRRFLRKVKKKYEALFAEGDLFLVEGPHMRSLLHQLGCPAEKTRIQRIAIPVGDIPFRPRGPLRSGEKARLLCTGRLVEKKGFMDALRAVREARRNNSCFELRIIGEGPLKRDLQGFISSNDMGGYVTLLGFLGYGDYLEELSGADICLQPSVTASDGDSEGGAPTTLLEAQASGTPVVTTSHCDIPNVVLPGENALLCREGDWRAMAENILFLLENQDQWRMMGERGRAFVEERHDIAREALALESRYSELVAAGAGGLR